MSLPLPSLEVVFNKTASQTPFVLGVIRSLRQNLPKLPSPAGKQLMEKFAGQVIDAMELARLSNCGAASEPINTTSAISNGLPGRQNILPVHLVSFIECLVSEQIDDRLMMRLAFKIVIDCDVVDAHELLSLWAPFARLLQAAQEKCNFPPLTRRFRHISDAVIETAYVRFLGHKPRPLFFPQYRSVSCGCKICAQLNVFLAGDTEEVEIPAEPTDYAHLVCFLGGFWLKAIACKLERKPESVVFRKLVTYAGDVSQKTWLERSVQLRDALCGLDQDKVRKMQELMEMPEVDNTYDAGQDSFANKTPSQRLAAPGSTTESGATGQGLTGNLPPTTFQVYTAPPPLKPPEIREQARKLFFDEQTKLRQWNQWSSNGRKSRSATYKAIQREWDTNLALQDRYMATIMQADEARRQRRTTVVSNDVKKTVFNTDRYSRPPAPAPLRTPVAATRSVLSPPNRPLALKARAATRSVLPPPNRPPTPPRIKMPLGASHAALPPPHGGPLNSPLVPAHLVTTRAATRSVLPPPNRPPQPPRIRMPLGASHSALHPYQRSAPTGSAATLPVLPPPNRGPESEAFVAELEPRLRSSALTSFSDAGSIRNVLSRRWDAMTPKQRQGYVDKFQSKQPAPASSPLNMINLMEAPVKPVTPAPLGTAERASPLIKRDPVTPSAGATSNQNKRKTPGSGRLMKETWRGWRPGPPSSPSSRTLTPVSGNRVATPQTQTGSSQGLKRKQPIVIDLTLDD